jgi:hypothetical protein
VGATVESVQRFLDANPEIADSPEAALALKAAELLDDVSSSTTSKSMVMTGYLRALETLRSMLPERVEEDNPLVGIRARRDAKLRLVGPGGVGSAGQAAS